MNKIELSHFRLFLAIRETGSLTAAAKRLGLTQPAASHQLKEAERRLGAELVFRRGRQLQLSIAGDALADAAEAALPQLHDAERAAKEKSNSVGTRLRIAFGSQDGMGWSAEVSSYLRSLPAPLLLDLIDAGDRAPTQCLLSGEADMALELSSISLSPLRKIHVAEEELVAIMAPGHPLAIAAAVKAGAFAAETYFAHSLNPQKGFELDAFFKPSGQRPAHVALAQSLPAILALVAAGEGVSIQPHSAITASLSRGEVVARPLAPKRLRPSWQLHARPEILYQQGDKLLPSVAGVIANSIAYEVS